MALRSDQTPNRGAKSRLALTYHPGDQTTANPSKAGAVAGFRRVTRKTLRVWFWAVTCSRHRPVYNSTLSSRPCHSIHHRQTVEFSRTSALLTRDGGIPRGSNVSWSRNHRLKISNRSFRLSKPHQPRRRHHPGLHSPPCSRPRIHRAPRRHTVFHSQFLMIRSLSALCPRWRVWAWP